MELITKLVHLHLEADTTDVSPLVVPGNLGLVIHEDPHPELLLHGRGVRLVVVQLPGFPLFLDDDLEEGGSVDGGDDGEEENRFHLEMLC